MKRFLPLLGLAIALVAWNAPLQAQCPGCTIDNTCPTTAPDGGLCPEVIPAGTVGVPYDTDVTFYIPENVTDPGTGLNVDVLEVVISQVTGLPMGLDWECNNSATGCIYNPPASPPASELGCVRVCGTPIAAPGTYTVTVEVIATVVALGITLTQPQYYDITVDLLPSTSCATTFSFTGEPDCFDNYVTTFAGLVDGAPLPTTWDWTFGDGTTGTGKNPAPVAYPAPGTYDARLVTTIYDYVINEVHLNSMNDNWCGDVEEPNLFGICTANPDPFFDVRDPSSNIIYTSSTVDDVLSASWTGLNIVVPQTFSIEFTDEDVISQWDALGTFSFSLTNAGTYSFSGAGGTSGTIVIGTQVQQVFDETCTVNAFGNPFIGPSAAITDATTVGGSDGAIDITIAGGTPPYNFFWSNGSTTEDISGVPAGDYTVLIADQNGCNTNGTFTVSEPANVPCDPAPTGLLALPFSGTDVLLSWSSIVQPAVGYQLQGKEAGTVGWAQVKTTNTSVFVEGLIPGQAYEWRVRAKCSVTGNVSPFTATETFTMPTFREAAQQLPIPVAVTPNPTAGRLVVDYGLPSAQQVLIRVADPLGRVVFERTESRDAGFHALELDLSDFAPGVYHVGVQSERSREVVKVIVQ